jgi:formylglycine-generating enzyme required for sulfatase activity
MFLQSLVFLPFLPYPAGTTTQPWGWTVKVFVLSVFITVISIVWAIACMIDNKMMRRGIVGIVLGLLPLLTVMASFHLIVNVREWTFKPPKSVNQQPETMQLAIDDKTSIDLIYIEPGSFIMGRDTRFERTMLGRLLTWEASFNPYNQGPPRRVTITKGFYIGKYEVTTQQFCKFLNTVDNPEDNFKLNEYVRIEKKDKSYVPKPGWENCQMTIVHWRGAAAFCQWLSRRASLTVRLPTEAEWEYVARKPISRPYPWSWEIDEDPNKLATPEVDGVVGMPGGIGEWCSDFYGDRYLREDRIDPQGPREEDLSDKSVNPFEDSDRYHVLRQGGYVTMRWFGDEAGGSDNHGFRIVVMPPEENR